MSKTVVVPRGIPGSGKTTWTLEVMAAHPEGTVVRINNDDIVAMTFGKGWRRQEGIADTLRKVRETLLETYLKSPTIESVIIDNTNLSVKTVGSLQKIAHKHGADFWVNDFFLDVEVQKCIRRDSLRVNPVGEDVIRKMHKEAQRLKPWKVIEPPAVTEPYFNDPSRISCYVFDVDGTLALAKHRGPYDFDKLDSDLPNEPVVELLRTIQLTEAYQLIIMTGRDEKYRTQTAEWLEQHLYELTAKDYLLYMRPRDDRRPDYVVKNELFQEHVAGKYHVLGVFDDRDQVVDLWRNKLGLPTYQVANGDF